MIDKIGRTTTHDTPEPDFSREEEKEGLKSIRRVDRLLSDIIWSEWLRIRVSAFIKPRQVYSDVINGNSDRSDTSGVAPSAIKRIAKERARIAELRKKWEREGKRRDLNKEYADFTEHLAVVGAHKMYYLGKNTTVRQTDEIDDINRATDFTGHFKAIIDKTIKTSRGDTVTQEIVQQSMGFDTGDGVRFGAQKVTNAIRFINHGVLGQLLVAETTSEETGREMKGQQDMVPHFVIVVSHKRAAEMAKLFEESLDSGNWEKVAAHPIQIEMLQQALAQAKAYRAYAEHISFPNKDYKLSPVSKIGTRIVRDQRTRQKVFGIFARCIVLFDQALRERQAILDANLKNGSPAVQKMLQDYKPDSEFVKFMQLFKKEGKAQFARFRALLTVLPPVRYDEEQQGKRPIKVRVGGKEEELKQRFTKLVGIDQNDPWPSNNDDTPLEA